MTKHVWRVIGLVALTVWLGAAFVEFTKEPEMQVGGSTTRLKVMRATEETTSSKEVARPTDATTNEPTKQERQRTNEFLLGVDACKSKADELNAGTDCIDLLVEDLKQRYGDPPPGSGFPSLVASAKDRMERRHRSAVNKARRAERHQETLTRLAEADACERDQLSPSDRERCREIERGLSPWSVRESKSSLDDSPLVVVNTSSSSPPYCRWNRSTPVNLVIRCQENTTNIYLNTGCHMVSGDFTNLDRVDYRIDDRAPGRITMRESNDNRALGLWTGARAIPFIKRLFGGERLLVRMTPFNENSFETTFDISGLDEEIKPLRQACGW